MLILPKPSDLIFVYPKSIYLLSWQRLKALDFFICFMINSALFQRLNIHVRNENHFRAREDFLRMFSCNAVKKRLWFVLLVFSTKDNTAPFYCPNILGCRLTDIKFEFVVGLVGLRQSGNTARKQNGDSDDRAKSDGNLFLVSKSPRSVR